MGIFIYMNVSKSIADEEWEPFYEEATQLAQKFGLFDIMKREFYGGEMNCAVPVEEYEERGCRVWCTAGDLRSMQNAEGFYKPRDFRKGVMATGQEEEVDAILSVTSDSPYARISDHGGWNRHLWGLWFNKTQGLPYHMYLLAIACVAAERFGNRVYVHGNITRGQCRAAVKLAGEELGREIPLPDTCDAESLCCRISKLPLPEDEKVKMFFLTYLGGVYDVKCREILLKYFPDGLEQYWENEFKNLKYINYEKMEEFQKFLSMGYELKELCEYISWHEEASDTIAEAFIRYIMKTELHNKEKDCQDWLVTDCESEEPDSIYTQMAQCLFGGARNWRINRYVPLDELEQILTAYFGMYCDVKAIIQEAVCQEDKDTPADRMNAFMNEQQEAVMEEAEEYDIWYHQQLPFYKEGNRLSPKMKENLDAFFLLYEGLHESEETYTSLDRGTLWEKCSFLIQNNRNLLLTEEQWNRIFKKIEEDKSSFARYYPMVRFRTTEPEFECAVRGLALNDDLWEYCRKNCLKVQE